MASPTIRAPRLLAHPRGIYVLFFTEMWERYSFYSMMAILVLYMNESLKFSVERSTQIYGFYQAAVYIMPVFGGVVADRWLGYSRTVVLGGILMMFGHLVLGIEALSFFYLGLGLLASGTGLLKPNIGTMVGNLYRDRPQLRDQGFNIYYMGVNIGAFVSPLTVAWLRAHYGWSIAFMSAAVAMLLSLIIFISFRRLVAEAAIRVTDARVDARLLDPHEIRSRVVTLLAIFGISLVFWIAFWQIFSTFTFWARDSTATTMSPETFQTFEPLGVILLSPVLVAVWVWLQKRNAEPSTPVKMLLGVVLVAVAFGLLGYAGTIGGDTGRVSPAWLIGANVIIAIGEIALSPMGMSLVNRLSPPTLRGVMMGGWFASLGFGGYFAGYIGRYWDRMPHSRFFFMVVGILVVAAVPLSLLTPQIKRTMARAEA